MVSIASLPNEILSMIFRLVTADPDSLAPTFSDPFDLATYRFSEYTRSYEPFSAKISITRVSKRWNVLATPFLCEYLFCASVRAHERSKRRILDGLARFLERTGGGMYTKRLDLDIGNFEYEWYDLRVRKRESARYISLPLDMEDFDEAEDIVNGGIYDHYSPIKHVTEDEYEEEEVRDEDEDLEVLYGWQRIVKLVPNLVIFTMPNSPASEPQDWAQQVLFSLSPALKPNLLRVDWFGNKGDISHLHLLSVICPQLQHVCFTINESPDRETSTDALSIDFPQAEALLIQFNRFSYEHPIPPFQPWELPKLNHLTYFLEAWAGLAILRPVLESVGRHLRSVEMPITHRSDRLTFLKELLNLLPNLETLIIDLFKTRIYPSGNNPTYHELIHRHDSLKVLGWRLRQTGWGYADVIFTHSCKEYFSLERFPSLQMVRIVHPHDFSEYARMMSASKDMVAIWRDLLKDWVPVVDFEGEPIVFDDDADNLEEMEDGSEQESE